MREGVATAEQELCPFKCDCQSAVDTIARLTAERDAATEALHAVYSDLAHVEKYGPGSVDFSGHLIAIPKILDGDQQSTPEMPEISASPKE